MSRDNKNFFTSRKMWIFLSLLSILLLSSLSIFINNKMFVLTQSNHDNSLKSLVETSKISLISSTERFKREIILWSSMSEVVNFSKRLSLIEKDITSLKQIHNEIYSILNPTKNILSFEGYFIISLNGTNLASSRIQNIGVKNLLLKNKDQWKRMKKGEVLLTNLMPSDVPLNDNNGRLVKDRSTIFVSSPIRSIDGKIIAIGVLRVNPRRAIWNVLERGRTGKSGETYAIDEDGILQSPHRFFSELRKLRPTDNLNVLKFKVQDLENRPTEMVKSLSQKKEGSNLTGYTNYRGVKVIGHWDWIEELNIGIASESDYSEAYSLYISLRFFVWGFCLVICILNIFLIRVSQKKIIFFTQKTNEAESLSNKIQSLALIGAWGKDLSNEKRSWTSEVYNIFDVPSESNIQELEFKKFFVGKSEKKFNNNFYKCKHLGLSFADDLEVVTFRGGRKWVRTTGEAIFDNEGNIIKVIGTVQDVTNSIRKSKEIKSLFDSINSSAIVGMTDKNGRIIYANDYFCQISQYEEDELIGQNHRILNSGEHSKEFFLDMWGTISSGQIWSGEVKNKAKDGSFYWTFTTISPNLDNNGDVEGFTAIRSDISERKEMEIQIELERSKAIHSSKLALIGEMSAGMAHEINNPLTVISGHMILLRRFDKELDGKISNTIEKIESSVARISKIIDSVRKFSRKEDGLVSVTQKANYIIEETMNIVKAKSFKQTVELKVEDIPDTEEVICDALAIEQVLVNLISNAIDENETKDEAWVEVSFKKNEKEALFIVRDSGLGIDNSKVDSIFNPFFTTKEIGKGTGLGLSISKGLIEDHGGHLKYQLIDGHTAFVVSLPLEKALKIAS